ncbi:MAG: hypothetical protein LBB62_03620 [Proteiniphilum sp.]|jgi:hypothetical protein|nr:hypothetical protein [Proteiniphilum sp.]
MNEHEGQNLLDFLATGINKKDPVIQAVLSDYEGHGATANEVTELVAFIDYYTRTDDVKKHEEESLEMIVKQFTKLRKQLEESDAVLLRRMRALTERACDEIWGNGPNMEHVFETYFGGIHAYVCESTNEESFLQNGDFEEEEHWIVADGAAYTADARFSKKRGLSFHGASGQSCLQTLTEVSAGVYTLHFFLKGKCGVIIQNSSGKYFNADEKVLWNETANPWQTAPVTNWFEHDDWRDAFCFVVLSTETAQLKIKFVSTGGREAYIDYVRFFLKPKNPSYTIVIQYEGYALEDKTLHLGKGTVDPIPGLDYSKESYFDTSYIVGRKGALQGVVYKSVLDAVRPRGIQSFVEFAERTETEP